MLKLFQEGVVPQNIPELMMSINEKFLKSLGDPEDMRRQMIRFEKVRNLLKLVWILDLVWQLISIIWSTIMISSRLLNSKTLSEKSLSS